MITRTSRFWGAVLVDGQPRCEVRDVTDDTERGDTLYNRVVPEFRWFRVADTRHMSGDECSGGVACQPGAPCRECIQTAARWWFVHAERTAQRIYRAATLHARDRTTQGWSASDYCACKKPHDSEGGALRCARKNGMPLVLEMNGHGDKLRWVEVSPTKAPGSLFAPPVSP